LNIDKFAVRRTNGFGMECSPLTGLI
jgi:hypothetical protein